MELPESKAKRLIKLCGSNDPLIIASQRGIIISYEDLGKVWGYFHYFNRVPLIHINNNLDEFGSRFTLAHEIGHYMLHPNINTPYLKANTLFSIDRIEREANQFALNLLIGSRIPEYNETMKSFLLRCEIPEDYHSFY
ncbi:ImmA/IrrE family metallo-endopeptidase [Paenibacillus odorifer]|uniref:ImmA/IrrE family metallo-endopeptidase n=1 Tax=Paenibacillus TaxID=44249 RepID=UPI00096FD727|nr:ImmA/IrrE family metallo-endopeptidase [Paenibacillus odorifer]OMC95951.1 ImmA/IrrE family metallo-endopeptidase [Paenibacillus odorifer]